MTIAITIEKLIEWTYAEQCANLADRTGYAIDWMGGIKSNMDALMQLAALGCHIDGEGPCEHQLRGYDVHPDAMAVHREVMDIPDRRTRELIVMHGIKRTMPDPLAEERVYIDPRAASGEMRIRMIYKNAHKSTGPIACKVPWCGGDMDMIAMARADYAAWRMAIDMVQERLAQCQLQTYHPIASSLPVDPWSGVDRAGENNPQMWQTAENRHSHASY